MGEYRKHIEKDAAVRRCRLTSPRLTLGLKGTWLFNQLESTYPLSKVLVFRCVNLHPYTALERRFQPVRILEPSPEDSLGILKGLRSTYEEHHGVTGWLWCKQAPPYSLTSTHTLRFFKV